MGRFCLFAHAELTERFRRARGFLYNLASLLKLIRSEKKRVDFWKILQIEEQKRFSKQMWQVLLANERKSDEKSKNSASRRRWCSV